MKTIKFIFLRVFEILTALIFGVMIDYFLFSKLLLLITGDSSIAENNFWRMSAIGILILIYWWYKAFSDKSILAVGLRSDEFDESKTLNWIDKKIQKSKPSKKN